MVTQWDRKLSTLLFSTGMRKGGGHEDFIGRHTKQATGRIPISWSHNRKKFDLRIEGSFIVISFGKPSSLHTPSPSSSTHEKAFRANSYSYRWKRGRSWPCFGTTLPALLCQSCSYADQHFFKHNFHKKKREVCIKTRSISASHSFKGWDNCKMVYCMKGKVSLEETSRFRKLGLT